MFPEKAFELDAPNGVVLLEVPKGDGFPKAFCAPPNGDDLLKVFCPPPNGVELLNVFCPLPNGDGLFSVFCPPPNGDGLPKVFAPAPNGDGLPNVFCPPPNGDGLLNVFNPPPKGDGFPKVFCTGAKGGKLLILLFPPPKEVEGLLKAVCPKGFEVDVAGPKGEDAEVALLNPNGVGDIEEFSKGDPVLLLFPKEEGAEPNTDGAGVLDVPNGEGLGADGLIAAN